MKEHRMINGESSEVWANVRPRQYEFVEFREDGNWFQGYWDRFWVYQASKGVNNYACGTILIIGLFKACFTGRRESKRQKRE